MAKSKWVPVSEFKGLTPAPKSVTTPAPAHADIARIAYDLWEKDGGPHGKDQSYWFKAEQILKKKPGF